MTFALSRFARVSLALVAGVCPVDSWADHGISAAAIAVVQHDLANTTNSVSVTATLSINGFQIRAGSNRGDYNVQVGTEATNDAATGVLITCVAENGRDHGEASGTNFCTTAMDYSRSGANAGSYFIPVFNAPVGDEYNINVAAAFFAYTTWLGGYARNAGDTNGGANNLFTGSPGLVLGTHFVDQGGGVSTVDLTSLGIDSRTDGLLLVTHGKNEDNYALSQINSNNGTWTVYIKDNGSDTSALEQDPVAFVFIPKTNPNVISGRFQGDGTRLLFSGPTPQFNVANISAGVWRLTIPGHSPATGLLILSAEGGLSQNQDNIVSYQPDGDGWLIQSRDLPPNPPSLQTPGSGLQPVASFVFIPAPTAALVSPATNASNVGASPVLKLAVSNAVPGELTVTFYGRQAPTPFPGPDFAIVVLPDTQFYAAEANGAVKGMFIAQTEWCITNRISRNIAYVAHLGDISNSGDIKNSLPNLAEWRNVTNAMYRLEDEDRVMLADGLPYGLAVGNHDQEPIGDPTGTTVFYNQYFGISHFAGRSYYAGHYGNNNNNHFDLFGAGGLDFIVLYFEYDTSPSAAVLEWGNEVLRTNAHRRAMVVTHYMGSARTPSTLSAQGSAIYNALKGNTNLFLLLGGHVSGEGSRQDTYNGNTVWTLISDYQSYVNGGNGFMRIMDFSPSNNIVVVQTYSPWTGEYETDEDSEFWFTYNMQAPGGSPGAPYSCLGTNTNVAPGELVTCTWPRLEPNKKYEWYVTVADASGNTATGGTWTFITGANAAPIASNRLFTIYGDQPARLTMAASDPEGDVVTFKTNSFPLRGLNSDFDTNAGAITYLPARGYRGSDRFIYQATDGMASSAATMNLVIVNPPDTNANGLPDAWEAAFGLSDPNADADGDGESNLEEYQANTNPTNAASVFSITEAHWSTNANFGLSWSSIGGTRYRVQFSNGNTNGGLGAGFYDLPRDLAVEMDPGPWGVGSTQKFLDDISQGGSATNNARYYRVKVTP